MDDQDVDFAAEVVCAVARAVIAADGDAEKLRGIPLGNTVTRLLAVRDDAGETDKSKLIELASAVWRAKEGDKEVLDHLPGLVRAVREWFGLRN